MSTCLSVSSSKIQTQVSVKFVKKFEQVDYEPELKTGEIVHLVKISLFQPIRFHYSTCRPYCLKLSFNSVEGCPIPLVYALLPDKKEINLLSPPQWSKS